MLEKLVTPSQDPILLHRFREWKADPITRQFFDEITQLMLAEYATPLPIDHNAAIVVAYQREGQRRAVYEMVNWEPSTLVKEDE